MISSPIVRVVCLIVLHLLVACSACAGDFVVATYNVQNYNEVDRMTESGYERRAPKPEGEKTALRKVIASLKADVLVMQEMGTEAHLRELQRDLKRDGIDFPYSGWVAGQDPDRHVAFLARVKPSGFVAHNAVETRGRQRDTVRRGVLEVRFPFGSGTLTIYGMHLKSRRTTDPADPDARQQRGREATAVRDLVLSQHPDAGGFYLMTGDFNDTRKTRTLTALQKRGKRVISIRVEARDSHGLVWTHRYSREGVYSNFDYMLLSPELSRLQQGRFARIVDLPETDEASDHRPVVISLRVPAGEPGREPAAKASTASAARSSVDDADGDVAEVAPPGDDAPED